MQEDGINRWRLKAVPGVWEGTTKRGQKVVEKLIHLLNPDFELNENPILIPGALLDLDNHRNAHGRPAITNEAGKPMDLATMAEEARTEVRWLERMQLQRSTQSARG